MIVTHEINKKQEFSFSDTLFSIWDGKPGWPIFWQGSCIDTMAHDNLKKFTFGLNMLTDFLDKTNLSIWYILRGIYNFKPHI